MEALINTLIFQYMAKSFSTTRPEKVAQYDHSHVILSYNIVTVEATEYRDAGFEFETLIVNKAEKGPIVEAIVRERYSISDELGIQRQRSIKEEEFNEYNDFVEAAKATADAILAE